MSKRKKIEQLIAEIRRKVAEYVDEQGRTAEYWYNLAYKGMWQNADWLNKSIC